MRCVRPASRFVRVLGLAVLASLALACGGDHEPDDGDPSSGGSGTRTGDRLSWDQAAPSWEQLRAYLFRVYVDGEPIGLTQVECARAASNGLFACSAPVPALSAGRHTLSMTAVYLGFESERSAQTSIVIPGSAGSGNTTLYSRAGSTISSSSSRATSSSAATVVLTSPHRLSAPVVLPDGRLLIVEDEARVRVVRERMLIPEPALVRARDTERILAVYPSASFPETGLVYVAWVEESGNGRRTVIVARYRELQDRLAEGAVVLTHGLHDQADPFVLLDGQDRIYVIAPDASDQSGVIFRFTADGRTPWELGQSSTLFATIDYPPHAVAIDRTRSLLWLAGRNANGAWRLTSLSSTDPNIPARQQRAVIVELSGISSLAVAEDPSRQHLAQLFLIDGNGLLHEFSIASSVASRQMSLPPEAAEAVSVASASDGQVFVVARSQDKIAFVLATLHAVARSQSP